MIFYIFFSLLGLQTLYFLIKTILCLADGINCSRYLELIALNTSLLVVGYGAIGDSGVYTLLNGLGYSIVLFMAFLVGANCGKDN
jgi:hypothetical protein